MQTSLARANADFVLLPHSVVAALTGTSISVVPFRTPLWLSRRIMDLLAGQIFAGLVMQVDIISRSEVRLEQSGLAFARTQFEIVG